MVLQELFTLTSAWYMYVHLHMYLDMCKDMC